MLFSKKNLISVATICLSKSQQCTVQNFAAWARIKARKPLLIKSQYLLSYLSCKNVIYFVRKLKTSAFHPCKVDFCFNFILPKNLRDARRRQNFLLCLGGIGSGTSKMPFTVPASPMAIHCLLTLLFVDAKTGNKRKIAKTCLILMMSTNPEWQLTFDRRAQLPNKDWLINSHDNIPTPDYEPIT